MKVEGFFWWMMIRSKTESQSERETPENEQGEEEHILDKFARIEQVPEEMAVDVDLDLDVEECGVSTKYNDLDKVNIIPDDEGHRRRRQRNFLTLFGASESCGHVQQLRLRMQTLLQTR